MQHQETFATRCETPDGIGPRPTVRSSSVPAFPYPGRQALRRPTRPFAPTPSRLIRRHLRSIRLRIFKTVPNEPPRLTVLASGTTPPSPSGGVSAAPHHIRPHTAPCGAHQALQDLPHAPTAVLSEDPGRPGGADPLPLPRFYARSRSFRLRRAQRLETPHIPQDTACGRRCVSGVFSTKKPEEKCMDEQKLERVTVNQAYCKGCGICIHICPKNALTLNAHDKAELDEELCIACGMCERYCPDLAISMVKTDSAPCQTETAQ